MSVDLVVQYFIDVFKNHTMKLMTSITEDRHLSLTNNPFKGSKGSDML